LKRQVYMDHAATSPLRKEALEAMMPFLQGKYGNPSSIHSLGREVRKAIEEARERVATSIGAEPAEIYFTAGGTESNNLALRGAAAARGGKGHIITSSIEHHAVLDVFKDLGKDGLKVTFLPVDRYGMVSLEDVAGAITEETFLISVMTANNEVGTIQPVEEIGALAREKGLLFHTDAVQAVGQIPVNVNRLNADLLSFSSHKFNGPKGAGALYVRKGTRLKPLWSGGGQERKLRPGTENVPGIIGMATALELAVSELEDKATRLQELRDRMIAGLLELDHVVLNGHPEKRLPGNVNVSFKYIEGESILLSLDLAGVAASSGSACSSGSLDPSHVLLAMGLDHQLAQGSVRFSLGYGSSDQDVDYLLEKIKPIVDRLLRMSAIYKKIKPCYYTREVARLYNEKVIDHFTNPRNVGELENADAVGETGNFKCGDVMKIYLKIKDDVIEDVKFQTFGCAAAIASSSVLTEMVKGKTLKEAQAITNRDVANELGGLPPVKMHCSNLAADALKNAIDNYEKRR
jgi:cysteine desulfurase